MTLQEVNTLVPMWIYAAADRTVGSILNSQNVEVTFFPFHQQGVKVPVTLPIACLSDYLDVFATLKGGRL